MLSWVVVLAFWCTYPWKVLSDWFFFSYKFSATRQISKGVLIFLWLLLELRIKLLNFWNSFYFNYGSFSFICVILMIGFGESFTKSKSTLIGFLCCVFEFVWKFIQLKLKSDHHRFMIRYCFNLYNYNQILFLWLDYMIILVKV